MNCEEFEDLMIIYIYGKLTTQEQERFNHHLSRCSDCAAEFERIGEQQTLSENSEIPQPDWENSWEVIVEKSVRKKINPRNPRKSIDVLQLRPAFQKYVLAAASLILVFIIGFVVGRKFMVTTPETSPGTYSELSLQTFAENLEPILIDFLNRNDRPVSREFDQFEKEIVKELLVKARLMKFIMQKKENQQLVQLLNDVEFILLNLSNLRPDDFLSTKQIQQFIREKKLKVQLKLVANEKIAI